MFDEDWCGNDAVLNARGHRRGSHPIPRAMDLAPGRCSTPEGIEGGRTSPRLPRPSNHHSAQRPRASKGVAPASRSAIGQPLVQCSTPEGIEGGRTSAAPAPPPAAASAQRPRASKGVALDGRGAAVPPFRRVLNARGHRRGSHEKTEVNHDRLGPLVLNARGHRRGSHSWCLHCQVWFVNECSTPEGIEGGRTVRLEAIDAVETEGCSTPEGIEGGRTSA